MPDPRVTTPFADPRTLAVCHGVPVTTYGYTHILAAAPDLLDDAPLQVGNEAPRVKVPVKCSAEIGSNRLGATTPRMPRTAANDYTPLEAIHLIDGDPTTCWCSRTQPSADAETVWIRLDLPLERTLTRVTLRKRVPAPREQFGSMHLDTGAVEVGMALPAELEVQLSRDGATWATVFHGTTADTPDLRAFTVDFPAQPAKQIRVIGTHLPRVENWLHGFSISAVEVYDAAGQDAALVTRGTGVQTSSTQHSMGQTTDEHRWLWPIHTDLGLKWARIGYHDDPVNWHWVEKTPGVLAMDPEADAAVTYLVERGVDIVLALGFGNRHYCQPDPTRRLPQLWEWYYENPKPPTTPEALAAWERYVRYMVTHFRDRVKVFEIWNEWNCEPYWGDAPNLADYLALARVTIPIIRELAPEAQVMLGSFAGFPHGIATTPAAELEAGSWTGPMLESIRALAADVDLIGYHPFYQCDPDEPRFRGYIADVRAFAGYCAAHGFRGELLASEWNYAANYPAPTPPNWWGDWTCSEIAKAKIVAQLSVAHTALGVGSFFCETWSNYYPLDLTLLRRGTAADPITPQQPQAAYYAMRNLAGALDGLQPAAFPVTVTGAEVVALPLIGAVALWLPGRPVDVHPGTPVTVTLDGTHHATAYDPLNGVEQALRVEHEGGQTVIPGLLVRDCPVLVRVT